MFGQAEIVFLTWEIYVVGAVPAVELQLAGGVVHPVAADVQPGGLLAQRVDEGVADSAQAGWLVRSPRKDDLGVLAIVG